jgi:site-specific DNA recombinase
MNAVIYSRVSHVNQAEKGTSIENQVDNLRQYCKLKGWTVVGEYVDPAVSGRNFNRPQFIRMLGDLRPKLVNVVVVHSLTRFGRNTREMLNHIDTLDKQGVMFYSMYLGVDTTTSHGKMILSVMSAMAQFESDNTSDRIKSVMSNRKGKGLSYCGNPPLGFDSVDGVLVPNADMDTVEHIQKAHSNGQSLGSIAAELNRLQIKGAKGGSFQASTIRKILNNKIYEDKFAL